MATPVKEKEKIKMQEEMVIEVSEREISDETREKGHHYIENYVNFLKDRTEGYKMRIAESIAKPQAGAPVLVNDYQYWNCLTVGPIQFFGNPPYRPSKIIAAGEWTLMLGVIWINPANGPLGSLPGTVVLGDRDYRVWFETINLTQVTNGPDRLFTGTFDNPADDVYVFPWWRIWPDPGLNPNLYEVNLTADIVQAGQPMAAFSTWHYDTDREPGFLVDLSFLDPNLNIPPWLSTFTQWPGLQHERPARFMVYRE